MNDLLVASLSTLAIAAAAALLPVTTSAETIKNMSQHEQAVCGAANTTQSEADCLYEMRSVRRDAMAGKAPLALSAQELAANALSRCQVQPVKEREACVRMVRGMGTRDGSVAQGGVVMEITTTTVTPAPEPLPR